MDNEIRLFTVNMPPEVDRPLLETLHSGYITEGPKVKEFEAKLGKLIDNPFVAALNSGTSALTLALKLANVGPGDEVITTAMTCSATNLPILQFGATPVWADIHPENGLINPESITTLITEKTKAIMCVDWGGLPCDIESIMAIAKAKGIKVIEDAAHSLGSSIGGWPIGSLADFTCFSFQAIKHITTVDGGAIACLNEDDYKRAKRLRWFGIDREAQAKDTRIDLDIEEAGYKFHMNDVAATIGLVQLDSLSDVLERRNHIAMRYDMELSDKFTKPRLRGATSSYWLYTIVLNNQPDTTALKEHLALYGIQSSKVHRRNDEYTVFKGYSKSHFYRGLSYFYDHMLCIPLHQDMSNDDVTRVIEACNSFIGS